MKWNNGESNSTTEMDTTPVKKTPKDTIDINELDLKNSNEKQTQADEQSLSFEKPIRIIMWRHTRREVAVSM